MKIFILIFTTLFIFKANAQSKYYIIYESKIEFRTHQLRGALNERCPSGLTNIQDLTYLKQGAVSCVDQEDCELKSQGICQPDLETDLGRMVIAEDYSEVYCVKPIFDSAKNAARLLAESNQRDAEAIIRADKAVRRNQCDIDSELPTMTLPQITACIKVLMNK